LKSQLVEPSAPSATDVIVSEVDLENYDQLLSAHTQPTYITPWDEIDSLNDNAGAGGAL
jgi:hypothetical protein